MMTRAILATAACVGTLFTTSAWADIVTCAPSQEPWANGFCARAHTKPYGPEGWLRGSARFNKTNGDLEISVQIESDTVSSGGCGFVYVDLGNAKGDVLATFQTGIACRGGKKPGKAERTDWPVRIAAAVSAETAKEVTTVVVRPVVTGKRTQVGNVSLADVANVAKTILGTSNPTATTTTP